MLLYCFSEQEYEDENEINPTEANPLLADLGQTGESLSKQAELWFKRVRLSYTTPQSVTVDWKNFAIEKYLRKLITTIITI